MATAKKSQAAKSVTISVDAFMAEMEHPHKREIQALRAIILGASPKIAESIKWKAPSFSCNEHFATFNLRAKEGVQIVFHLGAKVKAASRIRTEISDPAALLSWLANDRALIKLADMKTIESNAEALEAIVQQWITHVE